MRKNRSFKEQSFARSRGSKGKEVSTELQKSKPSTTRLDEPSRNLNSSGWQQKPSISQNILRQIISYSNLSQSKRAPKATTISVFDKSNDGVLGQLAKIKKASLGQVLPIRETKRLTIDFAEGKQNRTVEGVQLSKSIEIPSSLPDFKQQSEVIINCRSFAFTERDYQEKCKLQEEKVRLTSNLQQLTILEESIQNEYSQMIPHWTNMILCENQIQKRQWCINQLQKSIAQYRVSLDEASIKLLNNNRDFVASRKEWETKGSGIRGQLLQQAQFAHSEFLRRLTTKDFQETLLFNMKVAIPDYKGSTSNGRIYEQLFHSHSAKKFTMILKKHAAHMDLYDGRLLSDFTKRINDIQVLYNKAEADSKHPDTHFFQVMAHAVSRIDQLRASISAKEGELQRQKKCLKLQQQQNRRCEEMIHKLIDEMNIQVRGQYQRQTDKEADFKSLLMAKLAVIYQEFRSIREKRERAGVELRLLQQKLAQMPQQYF